MTFLIEITIDDAGAQHNLKRRSRAHTAHSRAYSPSLHVHAEQQSSYTSEANTWDNQLISQAKYNTNLQATTYVSRYTRQYMQTSTLNAAVTLSYRLCTGASSQQQKNFKARRNRAYHAAQLSPMKLTHAPATHTQALHMHRTRPERLCALQMPVINDI